MRSNLTAELDCEQSLTARSHAFLASSRASTNQVEIDAAVVHALLQARYYDGSKGEFLSEDPTFLAVGTPKLAEILNRVNGTPNRDEQAALQQFLGDPQLMNSSGYA